MKNLSLVLVLVITLSSCVSTKVSSLKDPDYRNKRFSRVLVIGNFDKIEMTKKMESELVSDLGERGIYAVANSDLLPPLREYTDDEKRNVFISEKLDCYLVLSQAGVNNVIFHVPSTMRTTASVDQSHIGKHKTIDARATATSTSGYSTEVVESIDFKGDLFDITNGKLAWTCEANAALNRTSDGTSYAGTDDIVSSVSSNIVDELDRSLILTMKPQY
jgi:hypothetical protein